MDRVAAADLAAATRSCAQRQHQLGLTANRARHAARRALEALLHPARDELPRAVHCNNCVTCDTGFVATAARASHDDGNAADRCEQDYDIRSKYLIKFKGNNGAWVEDDGSLRSRFGHAVRMLNERSLAAITDARTIQLEV